MRRRGRKRRKRRRRRRWWRWRVDGGKEVPGRMKGNRKKRVLPSGGSLYSSRVFVLRSPSLSLPLSLSLSLSFSLSHRSLSPFLFISPRKQRQ